MVTSGQARSYRPVHQNASAPPSESVKATSRPPGPRIGGGIRILRGGTGLSSLNKHPKAKNGQAEAGPLPLYRRMLYPGPADRAPQILQTPGCEQVDTELYNLLALVCRGLITPWYSKISKDRAFFLEIVRVASHVFRQLEARLVEIDGDEHSEKAQQRVSPSAPQKIDKTRLMFDTLPSILERHIQDYHTAKERSKSAYSSGASAQDGLSSLEVYFHSLQPHSAITTHTSPDQASPERLPPTINADYIRAAIEALLEALMPNEDFQADTERSVVREVIVGIVLEGVFRKVAQPWFIYGLVAKSLEPRPSDMAVPPTMQQSFPTPIPNQAKTPISVTPQEWWARLASLVAALPIYFSQLVALFGYLSYLFTTSFASHYYKRYSKRQHHLSDVVRPWTNLILTAVSSGSASRQTLSQVGRTAQALATLASPLLDR